MPERIVVGVDDSPAALEALKWSVREAGRRRAQVEAVGVWEVLTVSVPGVVVPIATDENQADHRFARLVAAIEVSGAEGLGVSVTPRVEEGAAGQVLTELAEGASLLVVGRSGASAMAGLLGSTGSYLARHAPCPLVLVPAPAPRSA